MKLFYSGQADSIATWDIDRLSRNEVDEGTIKWAVRQRKILQIHTHNTIYTENELLMMGIFLSLWAEEVAKLRQRVMRGMKSMIAKGKVPYKAPYGYRNHEGGVIPDEEEKDVLSAIFQRRADGYSLKQIAEWLNERGIRTRSGNKWITGSLDRIISNEFYVGVTKFASQVGEGIFERIISRDLWDRVNSTNRTNGGYMKHGFALKGIVVSAITWKPLKASLIKKKYVYYHDDKHGISISEKEIFEKMEEIVGLWKIPSEYLSKIEEGILKEIHEGNNAVLAERTKLEKKIAELKKKKKNVASMYMDGKVDEEDYQDKIKEIALAEMKYVDDLDGLAWFDLVLEEEFSELVKLIRNLDGYYKLGDDDTKGCILQNALVKLEIDEQKRLIGHEKEPFTWLSSLNTSNWYSQRDSNSCYHRERVMS